MVIEDLEYGIGQYKHIFHKGNDNINASVSPIGLNEPNNGPGLYISHNKNDLIVIMNTFEKINEEIIPGSICYIKFIIDNPISPLELLQSPDARKLGILVESLELINN